MGDNLFARTGKFLNGYVTVTVEGMFLEKFTNLCAVNCLPFWDVRRCGTAKMIGRTTISGYKKMRHIVKKCGCRVYISKKRGLPFFLYRYRKRKIFAVGVVLFLVILEISSMFIFSIEVTGNKSDIAGEIIAYIEETGIKRGTLKNKIDADEIINNLMINRSDLSWVGVETDGFKLKIEVVEKVKIPEKTDENETCNIVAGKPGLIVSIKTLQGVEIAKVNDIVSKGDVLVSGFIEMKQFPERNQKVHSLAEIKARVWYERGKTLNLSKKRPNSQIEMFAYNIAYDKILQELPKDAKVLNVTKKVLYFEGKVLVDVTVETLEDIGVNAGI